MLPVAITVLLGCQSTATTEDLCFEIISGIHQSSVFSNLGRGKKSVCTKRKVRCHKTHYRRLYLQIGTRLAPLVTANLLPVYTAQRNNLVTCHTRLIGVKFLREWTRCHRHRTFRAPLRSKSRAGDAQNHKTLYPFASLFVDFCRGNGVSRCAM